MEWQAYFSIDNEEFNYMTFRCSSYDEAREKVRFERAIEGFTEAPVKFLDLFAVVTAADIPAALPPPR
jgi:hypothetical protein